MWESLRQGSLVQLRGLGTCLSHRGKETERGESPHIPRSPVGGDKPLARLVGREEGHKEGSKRKQVPKWVSPALDTNPLPVPAAHRPVAMGLSSCIHSASAWAFDPVFPLTSHQCRQKEACIARAQTTGSQGGLWCILGPRGLVTHRPDCIWSREAARLDNTGFCTPRAAPLPGCTVFCNRLYFFRALVSSLMRWVTTKVEEMVLTLLWGLLRGTTSYNYPSGT
jgi:hypothetical protein